MTKTAQSDIDGWGGTWARSLSLDRLARNLGVMSKSSTGQKALGNASRFLKLDKARQHLNMRDMQRVIVRKPV